MDINLSKTVRGTKSRVWSNIWRVLKRPVLGINSRNPFGTNVFEKDWDILILLDTCRIDAINEVSDEYWFLQDIGELLSVGSTSPEWIANTFVSKYKDEINSTAYLTNNSYSKRVLEEQKFPLDDHFLGSIWTDWRTVDKNELLYLEYTWQYLPSHKYHRYHPQGIFDRGIQVWKDRKPNRLLIHSIQPHSPYVSNLILNNASLKRYEENPFEYLQEGGNFKNVWKSYISSLRMALDQVEVFLNNINAEKVIISSDHGEAFGEFGIYGHPAGVPHPVVKKVPWVQTSAHDNGTYEPTIDAEKVDDYASTEDQLRALGYLD